MYKLLQPLLHHQGTDPCLRRENLALSRHRRMDWDTVAAGKGRRRQWRTTDGDKGKRMRLQKARKEHTIALGSVFIPR
jgi:hypothetical protein